MARKGVSIIVAVGVAAGTYFGVTQGLQGPSLEEAIAATVEEVRPDLPMQFDEMTSWETVEAEGTTLIYGYRLAMPALEVPAGALEASVVPVVTNGVCSDAEVRAMLDDGGTMRYVYSGSDGGLIGAFDVSAADC